MIDVSGIIKRIAYDYCGYGTRWQCSEHHGWSRTGEIINGYYISFAAESFL